MALRPDSEELFQIGAVPADDRIARALHYGGAQNGVLTAVEDFLASEEGKWDCLIVPGCFGLGLVYSPASLSQRQGNCIEAVRQAVQLLGGLIERLEYNRFDNHFRLHTCRQELKVKHQELRVKHQELEVKRQELEVKRQELLQTERLVQADAWFESAKRSLTWRLFARFTIGRNAPPLGRA